MDEAGWQVDARAHGGSFSSSSGQGAGERVARGRRDAIHMQGYEDHRPGPAKSECARRRWKIDGIGDSTRARRSTVVFALIRSSRHNAHHHHTASRSPHDAI